MSCLVQYLFSSIIDSDLIAKFEAVIDMLAIRTASQSFLRVHYSKSSGVLPGL